MPANQQFIKNWIQYLKSNQIVGNQSDPKTGKLKYYKPVTAEILKSFLQSSGVDPKVAEDAIKKVLNKKARASAKAQQPQTKAQPGQPQAAQAPTQPKQAGAAEAQQAQQRQPKPHYKLQPGPSVNGKPPVTYKGLREDIIDTPSEILDEKDVEDVFALVQRQMNKTSKTKSKAADPEEEKKKIIQLNKIKDIIRNTMTPQQRKMLWRALNV